MVLNHALMSRSTVMILKDIFKEGTQEGVIVNTSARMVQFTNFSIQVPGSNGSNVWFNSLSLVSRFQVPCL